jgi:hypothetical protein
MLLDKRFQRNDKMGPNNSSGNALSWKDVPVKACILIMAFFNKFNVLFAAHVNAKTVLQG